MISDLAHKQNLADRADLAAKGYSISIGHDGWSILLNSDEVAKGYPERGLIGEPRQRQCLDAAVHKAKQLYAAAHPPAPVTPTAEDKPVVGSGIHARAVATAIGFLRTAGATYTVEFDGKVFTNVKPGRGGKRELKTEFRQHYLPFVKELAEVGEGMKEISVPENLDWKGYTDSFRSFVHEQFGKGRYLTSTDRATRTVTLMVSAAEVKE